MFDLDREVAAWSRDVHGGRCSARAAAELTDHFYCEIEEGRARGLGDEEAFAAAAEKLGSRPDLVVENAKNRTWWQMTCAGSARADRTPPRPARRAIIIHAIVWAGVMLAASLLAKRTAASDQASAIVLSLTIAGWILSEQALRYVLRARAGQGG
jgi:hypothetical protein